MGPSSRSPRAPVSPRPAMRSTITVVTTTINQYYSYYYHY